jgi:site-specific DNA recombinase
MATLSDTQPVLIYVRVSRQGDREDGKFHSPDDQVRRASKFAEDNGFAVGQVFRDIDQSGGTHPLQRPGMAAALLEIEAGRAGGIVAYDMSRLSREPSHLEWLAAKMDEHGAVLLWPNMPVDPRSAVGELQIGLLAQFDRYTRKQATERFALAKERATREGIHVARTMPLGYRKDPATRRMVVDESSAPIVRELFERRIAGASDTALARFLTERTGRQWARQAVAYMLANPIYHVGRLTDGETVSEFEAGAILDSATWHAAQRPKFIHDERTASGKWLLTGLAKCDVCGRRLSPWNPSAKEKAKGTRGRYRCNGEGCRSVSVHREVLEALVVEAAFAACQDLIAKPPVTVDLAALEQERLVAERRFEQVQSPEMQDALGDAWPATAKARREERDSVRVALGEARAEAGVPELGGAVLNLGWIWDDLAPDQQRVALQEVYAEVRVARGEAVRVPITLMDGTSVTAETPALTFVPREPHPWRPVEMAPADVVRQQ